MLNAEARQTARQTAATVLTLKISNFKHQISNFTFQTSNSKAYGIIPNFKFNLNDSFQIQ